MAVIGLGGVLVWALMPYATSYVSTSAVVNAPLASVSSPFDGRITEPSNAVGTAVEPGDALIRIESQRRDRRYLEQLRGRRTVLTERIRAIERQRSALKQAARNMRERLARYRKGTVNRLEARKREVTAALQAAKARASRAARDARRSGDLVGKGFVSEVTHDRNETDRRIGSAQVRELQAQLARIQLDLEAAKQGTFLRDGFNDVPYSQQREDEIALRLVELAGKRAELAIELSSVEDQLDAEADRLAKLETFQPQAPGYGVVWKSSGIGGEFVAPDQEVVQIADCENRFVEVAVRERHFDDIRTGDRARVQLKGSDRVIWAKVVALRGAGARGEHERLAAKVPALISGQLRVLVSLEGVGLGRDASSFCHIGRTAEVRFPRGTAKIGRIIAERMASLVKAIKVVWQGPQSQDEPGRSETAASTPPKALPRADGKRRKRAAVRSPRSRRRQARCGRSLTR